MPDSQTALQTQKRIGDSKEYLAGMLRAVRLTMTGSTLATARLKPDEEVRPVLDAKPMPKFYEVIGRCPEFS